KNSEAAEVSFVQDGTHVLTTFQLSSVSMVALFWEMAMKLPFLAVTITLASPLIACGQDEKAPVTAESALDFFRQQKWDKAAEAYARVLKINPYDGAHWFNYSRALDKLKRYEEAIPAATKAAELGYQPSLALYKFASAYAHLGSTDKAVEFL